MSFRFASRTTRNGRGAEMSRPDKAEAEVAAFVAAESIALT
jgi:hypothetical protein